MMANEKAVVDMSNIMKRRKPYADSTLKSMKKSELIKYIRDLEYNMNVAISWNRMLKDRIEQEEVESQWKWDENICWYRCESCGYVPSVGACGSPKFCPNCGLKMRNDAPDLSETQIG